MAQPHSVSYEEIEEAANFLLEKVPEKPKLGIICGKGLDSLADMFADKIDIPYTEIPNYPECKVHEHTAILTYGTIDGLPVVCFRGRFHFHEGYSPSITVLPVRLLKLMGVKLVILTNAGGGINPDYKIGDIVLLKDHVNLVAFTDIQMADERWGAPNKAVRYDKNLREKAKQAFAKVGAEVTIHEGIYACSAGSRFHSVAEISLLKQWGCDVVGTSLAHEALTARNCGLEVLGLSVVHRLCSSDYDAENKEEDVNGGPLLQPFLDQYIKDLAPDLKPPPEEPPIEEPPTEEEPPATEEAPPEEPLATEEATSQEAEAPSQEVPPEGTSAKPSVTEKPSEPGPPAPEGPKKKKACECKGKSKEGQERPSTGSAVASKASTPSPPVESKKSLEGPTKEDEQKKKKRSCECKNNPLKRQETKEEEKKETKVEEPKEEEKQETQEEETKEEGKKEEETKVEETTEKDNKGEENKEEEGA